MNDKNWIIACSTLAEANAIRNHLHHVPEQHSRFKVIETPNRMPGSLPYMVYYERQEQNMPDAALREAAERAQSFQSGWRAHRNTAAEAVANI